MNILCVFVVNFFMRQLELCVIHMDIKIIIAKESYTIKLTNCLSHDCLTKTLLRVIYNIHHISCRQTKHIDDSDGRTPQP